MVDEIKKKPNIFKRFFMMLGYKFKILRPLVLMQFKDKIDFSFLKSKKKTLFKIIFSALMFVFVLTNIKL